MPTKKVMAVYRCEISGGTDKLLIHLINNWPEQDVNWTLYLHQDNSGKKLMSRELQLPNVHIRTYKTKSGVFTEDRKGLRGLIRKITVVLNFMNLIPYFYAQIRKEKPDLLYLHQGGFIGAIDAHIAAFATILFPRLRVVMSIQNLPSLIGRGVRQWIFNSIDNWFVDDFIFATEKTSHVYKDVTNLMPSKFNIIPEGVDVNRNNIHRHNDGIVNVGMIGAYEERKGHKVLFKAGKILSQDLGSDIFRIVCYGQPEYGDYEELMTAAESLGIKHLVRFCEFEEDMDMLYPDLDIIVSPSIDFESMPLVLIDAQAYYKPIIASELQGAVEVVQPGENGYLFPVGDYNALAEYMKILILDAGKRETFGLNGRRIYEQKFTAGKMAMAYSRVFSKKGNTFP